MRDNTLDKFRGLLILYIVAVVHGLFWLSSVPQLYSSLVLLEMPQIFIISGVAYYYFEQSKPEFLVHPLNLKQYFNYAFSRLLRILIPYFVYAFVCILIVYSFKLANEVHDYSVNSLIYQWLNPMTFGGQYTYGQLNSHLWFIHIFLLVALLMPLVTKLCTIKKSNIISVFVCSLIWFYLLSKVEFWRHDTLKQTLFYLLFAILGYSIIKSKCYFQSLNYPKISIFLGLALATIFLITGNIHTMNMQGNKFPPNHVFFLFSCLWTAIFFHLAFKKKNVINSISKLLDYGFMKPFLKYGYSIYLWQGLGYTLAIEVGKYMNFDLLIVWLLSLLLTIALGLVFGPVEIIKTRNLKTLFK